MARPPPALRYLFQAFRRPGNSRTSSALIDLLAAVTSVPYAPHEYQGSRRHASVAAGDNLSVNNVVNPIYPKYTLPRKAENLATSPRRKDPSAWVNVIDTYLPTKLRTGAYKFSSGDGQNEDLQPIHTLPLVLSRARQDCKADILSYIGVYQERWEAVDWLVKAMMEDYRGHRASKIMSEQVPGFSWPIGDQSLDQFTYNSFQVEHPRQSTLSLDYYTMGQHQELSGNSLVTGRKCLGEIWQCLGTMILQAADRSGEDPVYSVIMSHVFQILAHLHRIDAFPDSIYNYNPPHDTTVLQRPPTLHLLSRRIMSILSDIEWSIQWQDEISKALAQGYDLPEASFRPRVREFGPELWLDLVLWACVEGGWVSEGSWLVVEMEKRKQDRNTQWSTISWQKVCEAKAPELDWMSILKLEIDKTRLNQVGGVCIASGTDSTVDMGTRTISQEVVLTLLDGLANTCHSQGDDHDLKYFDLQTRIIACKNLLERHNPELDPVFLDAIILRVVESSGKGANYTPGTLQRFLDLRPMDPKTNTTASDYNSISVQNAESDGSGAMLGLLHRNLCSLSREGNLQASLGTFRKILDVVDSQRDRRIKTFAARLRNMYEAGEDGALLFRDEAKDEAPMPSPQIPVSALISFLDLVTSSKLFDLGRWLLLNDDVDGGVMDPALYADQNLQPALLRFATATADSRLLTKVLEKMKMPLTEPIVHALLRFQVVLGKWDVVEELLEYLRKTPGMAWKASDATAIAAAILQMEHGPSKNNNVDTISRAHEVLQKIVNGQYNSKRDPSQLPDLSEIKTANQLGRMFVKMPGYLSQLTRSSTKGTARSHASASITPNAFNVILEAVVECHGSLAGKMLWEQWCREPNTARPEKPSGSRRSAVVFDNDVAERIVTPTLYMLRAILRPIVKERRRLYATKSEQSAGAAKPENTDESNETEQESSKRTEKLELGEEERRVLDWGTDMYSKFGLKEREICREIGGPLPRPKARKVPGRV